MNEYVQILENYMSTPEDDFELKQLINDSFDQWEITKQFNGIKDHYYKTLIDDADLSYMLSEDPDGLEFSFVPAVKTYVHDYNDSDYFIRFLNSWMSEKYKNARNLPERYEDFDDAGKAIYDTLQKTGESLFYNLLSNALDNVENVQVVESGENVPQTVNSLTYMQNDEDVGQFLNYIGARSVSDLNGLSDEQIQKLNDFAANFDGYETGTIDDFIGTEDQTVQYGNLILAYNPYLDYVGIMEIDNSQNISQDLNTPTQQNISPIDGKSKRSALNFIYKNIVPKTDGIWKDEAWNGVNVFFKGLDEFNLNWDLVQNSRYFNFPYGVGGSIEIPRKEWYFKINFINDRGRENEFNGTVTASGAGSMKDPLDRYDVVVTMG